MRYLWTFLVGLVSFHLFANENTLLAADWKFQLGDVPQAKEPAFDDSQWQTVSVPHCWGWQEAQQGNTHYYRGPGWYRRELDIAPEPGRRYFLRFEAASSVADVYVNGDFVGEHRGAFGAFCFEITRDLAARGTNSLAVRVDNTPQPDIAPLSGDFAFYGGIYRPVKLIDTDENCFTLTDHASPGVAWLQTSVSPGQALLDVTAEVDNGTAHSETLTV